MSAGDPHTSWPDRTRLIDAAGRTVLVYSLAESARDGRPWADGVWRPDDVALDDAAAEGLRQLAAHAVSTSDTALVAAWQTAGAELLRHAHVMTHDLGRLTVHQRPADLGLRSLSAAQVGRHAEALAAINLAAYPAGHPDHEHETLAAAVAEMEAISRGELLGPVLPVSQVALRDGIVGAALIVDRPGTAPDGGPWVLDIFRDPASPAKGVGRALLHAALVAARHTGLPSMTLVVSHSNANARALYESFGFVDHSESWTLALP